MQDAPKQPGFLGGAIRGAHQVALPAQSRTTAASQAVTYFNGPFTPSEIKGAYDLNACADLDQRQLIHRLGWPQIDPLIVCSEAEMPDLLNVIERQNQPRRLRGFF